LINEAFTILSNKPPVKPKISGPTSGRVGQSCTYATTTTDPESDQLYFLFDWGDGTECDWVGPYDSDVVCYVSHNWSVKGDFEIKVKAKDEYELESQWSDPLEVSMPKNKTYFNAPFYNFLQNHPYLFQLLRQLLDL